MRVLWQTAGHPRRHLPGDCGRGAAYATVTQHDAVRGGVMSGKSGCVWCTTGMVDSVSERSKARATAVPTAPTSMYIPILTGFGELFVEPVLAEGEGGAKELHC